METVFPIAVRSTDLDAQRHVARLAHLGRLGFLPTYSSGDGPRHSISIAETTCRYKAPVYYGDTLLVTVMTREVRQRSFTLSYEVRREAGGVLVAEGESAQVWIDEQERPARLPDAARRSLEASLGG